MTAECGSNIARMPWKTSSLSSLMCRGEVLPCRSMEAKYPDGRGAYATSSCDSRSRSGEQRPSDGGGLCLGDAGSFGRFTEQAGGVVGGDTHASRDEADRDVDEAL